MSNEQKLATEVSQLAPFSGEHIERGVFGLYSANRTLVATLGDAHSAELIANALNLVASMAKSEVADNV